MYSVRCCEIRYQNATIAEYRDRSIPTRVKKITYQLTHLIARAYGVAIDWFALTGPLAWLSLFYLFAPD